REDQPGSGADRDASAGAVLTFASDVTTRPGGMTEGRAVPTRQCGGKDRGRHRDVLASEHMHTPWQETSRVATRPGERTGCATRLAGDARPATARQACGRSGLSSRIRGTGLEDDRPAVHVAAADGALGQWLPPSLRRARLES